MAAFKVILYIVYIITEVEIFVTALVTMGSDSAVG
jgi:hypothetical protein